MKAAAFDQTFDEGKEGIIDDPDLSQLKRPGYDQRRIDIDFPILDTKLKDKADDSTQCSRNT